MALQKKDLVTHMYTADPSAHVFEGKIFVYPSHDLPHDGGNNDNGDQYKMEDYHVFSMPGPDGPVTDHGQVLNVRDVPWAEKQMWAPDAAHKNGKYYLIFPARDYEGVFRIGIAVGDRPEGPFVAEKEAIPNSLSIDPAVFVDTDNRAYMYMGGLWGGQLEKWADSNFTKFDENSKGPQGSEPALGVIMAEMSEDMLTFAEKPFEVKILDENGKPIEAQDNDRRFFEAAWVHKHDNTYYLSYSTGDTHFLCYATAPTPKGPFTYRGRIMTPPVGWTTHHSIVEFEGKTYLFYHDAQRSGGVNHLRSVKFQELTYNPDGTFQEVTP